MTTNKRNKKGSREELAQTCGLNHHTHRWPYAGRLGDELLLGALCLAILPEGFGGIGYTLQEAAPFFFGVLTLYSMGVLLTFIHVRIWTFWLVAVVDGAETQQELAHGLADAGNTMGAFVVASGIERSINALVDDKVKRGWMVVSTVAPEIGRAGLFSVITLLVVGITWGVITGGWWIVLALLPTMFMRVVIVGGMLAAAKLSVRILQVYTDDTLDSYIDNYLNE